MRTWLGGAILAVALGSAGCGALDGYVHKSNHFAWGQGTVEERHVTTSMTRTVENIRYVLKDRNYSIEKVDVGDEQAQVRAVKDGRSVIFDVSSLEEGARVHLEISQAGANNEAWALLTDVAQMP